MPEIDALAVLRRPPDDRRQVIGGGSPGGSAHTNVDAFMP